MLALIEQSPDIYLDEIQEGLQELHDIKISLPSIGRTLKRLGMSAKKVCSIPHLFLPKGFYKNVSSSLGWLQSNVRIKGKSSAMRLVNIHRNILLQRMSPLSISSQRIEKMGGQSEVYVLRKGAAS
jgi:hypothetical protein